MKSLKLVTKPSDPLVVTRMLDVFAAIIWAIFSAWGFTASALGVATITDAVGSSYNFFWSLSIGILGAVNALAAASLFFKTPMGQITKKRIELSASSSLFVLLTLYPLFLFISALHGNENRGPAAVLALLYPAIPLARVWSLAFRIRNYAARTKR